VSAGPCGDCLRRSWLLARLGGHIERRHVERDPLRGVLALPDADLIEALAGSRAGELRRAWAGFDAAAARRGIRDASLRAACPHGGELRYPEALRRLPDAPAVVHLAGDAAAIEALDEVNGASTTGGLGGGAPGVAIVGARRASPYGLAVARSLGRGVAAAGLPVISGMALGADSAAHEGALAAGGATVAVLAGGAERPYPASKRALYRRILVAGGAAISEMPPGALVRRWAFPARNRLIAALAAVTVVVEAAERSGSLITADFADDLGRSVAAVPGRVTSPLSAGTNALLRDGAALVRDARDVLDLACGPAGPLASARADPAAVAVPAALRALRDDLACGRDTVAALVGGGRSLDDVLAGLAELELLGAVTRVAGGRYVPAA